MYDEDVPRKRVRQRPPSKPLVVGENGSSSESHYHNATQCGTFKEDSSTKPAIFDFIASFQEPPDIPAHLEVQRNHVNQRRGIRRRAFRGQRNKKDWFTDAEELIKAPFYTARDSDSNRVRRGGWNGGEELVVHQSEQPGIMASIVSRHPPCEEYQTDHDLPMPYQRLRDVGKFMPLDFPAIEL
jgi:hypothetical protein